MTRPPLISSAPRDYAARFEILIWTLTTDVFSRVKFCVCDSQTTENRLPEFLAIQRFEGGLITMFPGIRGIYMDLKGLKLSVARPVTMFRGRWYKVVQPPLIIQPAIVRGSPEDVERDAVGNAAEQFSSCSPSCG